MVHNVVEPIPGVVTAYPHQQINRWKWQLLKSHAELTWKRATTNEQKHKEVIMTQISYNVHLYEKVIPMYLPKFSVECQ